jgi:hypothetical protein
VVPDLAGREMPGKGFSEIMFFAYEVLGGSIDDIILK